VKNATKINLPLPDGYGIVCSEGDPCGCNDIPCDRFFADEPETVHLAKLTKVSELSEEEQKKWEEYPEVYLNIQPLLPLTLDPDETLWVGEDHLERWLEIKKRG